MNSSHFVRARQGPLHSVIYTADGGDEVRYSGGDWAWRNNNPGNIRPGKVSKRNGAIGTAGGFAIFSDVETGHEALLDSLKTTFWNKTLEQLTYSYAPPKENKTAKYLKFLRERTGVSDDRLIKDFTASQFEKLWRAIEKMEGGHPGKIETLSKKRISKVRKNNKGTIVAYFVDRLGWLSKNEAIRLTEQGKIDAVVSVSRAGNAYLKSRPDSIPANKLDNLG